MSGGGRKLAAATVQNRTQTPFWNWIRNRLLAVERQPKYSATGELITDGKQPYHNPLRFPKTQSARSPDPPALPGGVHHKLSDNYYLGRDGRRSVVPPAKLYAATEEGKVGAFGDINDQPVERAVLGVNKGPSENFGLKAPTPGFGYEWTRNIADEEGTQQKDQSLSNIEKFDKFYKLH
uniref:NADH dehydrogenase [ubiquinone] 1 alpha subcomplex subunit 7 n=1 Tax=Panagrellus redivivus TaxID=6233 RepID=A0A7E4W9I6_PANRE